MKIIWKMMNWFPSKLTGSIKNMSINKIEKRCTKSENIFLIYASDKVFLSKES
jgi:hypothetical protein